MDSDLWNKVLEEDNQFRRQLVDQVHDLHSSSWQFRSYTFNLCLLDYIYISPKWHVRVCYYMSCSPSWQVICDLASLVGSRTVNMGLVFQPE